MYCWETPLPPAASEETFPSSHRPPKDRTGGIALVGQENQAAGQVTAAREPRPAPLLQARGQNPLYMTVQNPYKIASSPVPTEPRADVGL